MVPQVVRGPFQVPETVLEELLTPLVLVGDESCRKTSTIGLMIPIGVRRTPRVKKRRSSPRRRGGIEPRTTRNEEARVTTKLLPKIPGGMDVRRAPQTGLVPSGKEGMQLVVRGRAGHGGIPLACMTQREITNLGRGSRVPRGMLWRLRMPGSGVVPPQPSTLPKLSRWRPHPLPLPPSLALDVSSCSSSSPVFIRNQGI
jgi:hypothetical protein